ncbi:hypothetical protein A2U01_0089145, partial [Trifolium medium]|nr:hypothetical protein [Trifolium medium]
MMARCAPMLRRVETCSANCAPRRIGWRVEPVREKEIIGASDDCAPRRRGRRVAP